MNNDEKILKALEALQTDLKEVKQGQAQTNERLSKLEDGQTRLADGQAHITTALEALAAGQESTKAELKADIHDLRVEVVKKIKDHENRIDELEKEVGLPHPHKH